MIIRQKLIRMLSTLLIIGGIALALYPLFTHYYSLFEQKKMIAAMENSGEVLPGESLEPAEDNTGPDVKAEQQAVPQEPDKTKELGMAILDIPAINLSVGVMKGTTQGVLKKGPGWYEQSALPGKGNTAIAGHRSMYGGWFKKLDQLQAGDKVTLKYKGNTYIYQVEKIYPVKSNDWSVIKPLGYQALTLTTCISNDDKHRLVVRAKMVSQ